MAERRVTLTVNGVERRLLVGESRTLLEVLREDLGLVGTKFGCELGECGACTVLVDDEPALACLTLAALCDGSSVTTVEGVPGEAAERIERAFAETGAAQCGYCTPGMVVLLYHLMRSGEPVDDVRSAISGNLCRCTGYHRIVEACERCLSQI